MKLLTVSKYKEKIEFDKIWGYQNGGHPPKQSCQNRGYCGTVRKYASIFQKSKVQNYERYFSEKYVTLRKYSIIFSVPTLELA